MPTMGSLFAGIGGFDLGFERAGFQTVWQVEINDYCRKVLAKHFPHAERFEDVRECGAHNLKPVDVICGGFPCQDISNAGLRAGIDGERSGLWREYARIISELRPKAVLIENVAALLSGKDALNRVRPGRCVCGWAYRRRRVHLRKALRWQRTRVFHAVLGSSDERSWQISAQLALASLRRKYQAWTEEGTESRPINRMGGVSGARSKCHSAGAAVLEGEERASATSYSAVELLGFVAEAKGRLYGVDGRGSDFGASLLEIEPGTEYAWPRIGADGGWLDCQACGRPVGDPASGYVFAPWIGTLLRTLSEIGYDAEWQVISAADVGAPHLRERYCEIAAKRLAQGVLDFA